MIYKNQDKTTENIKLNNLGIDTSILDKVLTRANISYTPVVDCQEEYHKYFEILESVNKKVIGGKLPMKRFMQNSPKFLSIFFFFIIWEGVALYIDNSLLFPRVSEIFSR